MADKTDKEIIAELEAEVASLKRELEDTRSGLGGIPTELRALVKEKRAAGLDLKSALESAKAQLHWDGVQKKEAEKAKATETK